MAISTLSITDIHKAFPSSPIMAMEEDFFIMDIAFHEGGETSLAYPCRFGGFVSMYCMSGEFNLSIGLDTYLVRRDNFAVSLPGDIVRLSRVTTEGDAKIRVMALSDRMLQQVEFDLSQAHLTFRNRVIRADIKYKVLIHRFRDIIGAVLFMKHSDSQRSLSLLLKSLTLEMAHIWERLMEAPVSSQSRGNRLTEDFVALVSQHHVEHRDLGFYAQKLGITPKYLTAAVKQASGRSAVEWISSYIMLEAKFYLKHTSADIKQIAYDLNFDSQADFYSYFKRHSGMSPTQYREE